jgi:hypothetical protein
MFEELDHGQVIRSPLTGRKTLLYYSAARHAATDQLFRGLTSPLFSPCRIDLQSEIGGHPVDWTG